MATLGYLTVGSCMYSSILEQSIIGILLRTFSVQFLSRCHNVLLWLLNFLFLFHKMYMCCEEVTAFIFLLFFCWVLLILGFPRVDRRKKTITDVYQAQILSKCLVPQMHKYAMLNGEICQLEPVPIARTCRSLLSNNIKRQTLLLTVSLKSSVPQTNVLSEIPVEREQKRTTSK